MFLAAVTIVAAALAISPAGTPAQVTLIKAGRLIDGTGKAPLENVTIVVRGDVIESVLRGPASAALQQGARVIDLSKHTVLPGLMDCHDHIAGSPGDGGDTQMLQETDAHQALWGALHAKITLEAGFTTIRNVGSGSYAEVALKRFINQGLFPGPRIYTATKGLGITGGHADINGWSPDVPLRGYAQIVDGVENVRHAVREQIKFGADLIKITASGGCCPRVTPFITSNTAKRRSAPRSKRRGGWAERWRLTRTRRKPSSTRLGREWRRSSTAASWTTKAWHS